LKNVNVNNISANALGFSFNAPIVLKQIRQQISEFEQSQAVAAVQADVVAHSMGGDIVRTMVIHP
jgi:esterase/lipase superfamily enzyme